MYIKLFRMNDSPQKIAAGFGLGVFLGVLPGAGPIAALFLAVLLRVNRASALFACLLTNTWLSIVIFVLSLKVGSVLTGNDWQSLRATYSGVIKNFHWDQVFHFSFLKIVSPILIGYFVTALCFAFLCYGMVLLAITTVRIMGRRKMGKNGTADEKDGFDRRG